MKQPPTPRGISSFMPGLALFKQFTPALLRPEVVAAVTVFAVLVPSAMAYGDLAGVNPVAGLYVALGAMVLYALFGTSKQLIMGPEATTAILTATAITAIAGGDPVRYAALAAALAILIGFISILGGIAKLGFITDFLSKPILVGYITGTTLIVIESQLPKLFGISTTNRDFFPQLFEVISKLDETHLLTFLLGISSIVILLLIRRINRAIPGPLVVVALGILSSVFFDLPARGVAVVGAVPAGLPPVGIPPIGISDFFVLLPTAFALTIIIYADEVLTARVFAAKHNQTIDPNQEFIAIGMANIGAGLLSGFPAATSGSRTVVADQMGGKTQLVGIIAAALTIVFLLFFTPLLAPLPTVVLAAIIIVASLGLLDVDAFRFLRGVSGAEFWLAIVTLVGVLTVGILQGILVAVTLSLINVIYHISRPHDALLDDVDAGGGVVYHEVSDKATTLTDPGLIVYRFDAPLIFANASYFTLRLNQLVAEAGAELKCVVLDAEAISDFDSTAAEALENIDKQLELRNVDFWVARANEPLRELFRTTGLTSRLGKENIYPSVRAAVVAFREHYGAAE